ncbi:MAG TPA: glycoside hydrolase family 25 protein, partial [Chthoniobacterales bacterium]|nr:glycoside hydrolase family 25 protein [Chthoniobacterales bacterium]
MPIILAAMKFSVIRILFLLLTLPVGAFAANNVVNLSHYDLMRPDFVAMKGEGILGVIHEASYPRLERDAYYRERHAVASRAGLLWGAYHFGDGTDPVRQADHFLRVVESSLSYSGQNGVLLVLDFEKNGHYPGGTMRVDQAVAFVERIRERTGNYPGIYCSEYRIRQVLYDRHVTPAQRRV